MRHLQIFARPLPCCWGHWMAARCWPTRQIPVGEVSTASKLFWTQPQDPGWRRSTTRKSPVSPAIWPRPKTGGVMGGLWAGGRSSPRLPSCHPDRPDHPARQAEGGEEVRRQHLAGVQGAEGGAFYDEKRNALVSSDLQHQVGGMVLYKSAVSAVPIMPWG